MTADADLLARSVAAGRAGGLDHVGACDAEPFEDARLTIEQRRAEGLDGGMQFTYRNPTRSTDPSATFPGVRSLVVGALGYAAAPSDPPRTPHGRVARYATADHYSRLRSALSDVAEVIREAGFRARVVADDNALVDRAAAVRAGLGWYGKSANVLVPGHGSWFVLGSVLTDAVLAGRPDPLPDGCGNCIRCIEGCPTGAIVAPGVIDARRCLAWHVQQDGEIPHEFRVALSDRLYGCDECQEVCPPSRREERNLSLVPVNVGIRHGRPQAGQIQAGRIQAGRIQAGRIDPGEWVDLVWLLEADDDQLMARVGSWYVPRRDPRFLRRNALVAYANSVVERRSEDPHSRRVDELLGRYLDCDDDLLAAHAAWASMRIGREDLLSAHRRDSRDVLSAERRRWFDPADHREDVPR